MSLQRALADDDNVVSNQTFNMSLDGDGGDWITASEDGESDDIVSDLRHEHQDTGIQSVMYLSMI